MDGSFEWPSDDEVAKFLEGRSPFSAFPEGGEEVRESLMSSGRARAAAISDELEGDAVVLIVARPRDFEGFALGMVEAFEGQGIDVKVGALWLGPSMLPGTPGLSGNLVTGSYIDDEHDAATHVIVATTVLDDWAVGISMLLWTGHKAPNAHPTLVMHRAERLELDAVLAESTLAFAHDQTFVADHIDRGDEFDRKNEFAVLPLADDPAYVPRFLGRRMELQAWRRQNPDAPLASPAPRLPSPFDK